MPAGSNYTWSALMLSFGKPLWVIGQNIDNVAVWMTAEEPPDDWYNDFDPLNANDLAEGDIESFPDLVTAARATAAVLLQPNMSGIAAALDAGASRTMFSTAVVSSDWADSHYGVAAAGAPPEYVVPGRGFNYLATLPLPPVVPAPEPLPPTPSPKPPTPAPPPPPPQGVTMITTDQATGYPIGTDPEGHFYKDDRITNMVIVTLPEHPQWNAGTPEFPVVDLVSEKDEDGSWGYTYFTKPASGTGSWGIYNRYHVNRDGSF